MNTAALARMQIRVVRTVFRSESARLARTQPRDTGAVDRLRARSVELLDHAQDCLNGDAVTSPELLDELQSARNELDEGAARELSAGLSGDRRG